MVVLQPLRGSNSTPSVSTLEVMTRSSAYSRMALRVFHAASRRRAACSSTSPARPRWLRRPTQAVKLMVIKPMATSEMAMMPPRRECRESSVVFIRVEVLECRELRDDKEIGGLALVFSVGGLRLRGRVGGRGGALEFRFA